MTTAGGERTNLLASYSAEKAKLEEDQRALNDQKGQHQKKTDELQALVAKRGKTIETQEESLEVLNTHLNEFKGTVRSHEETVNRMQAEIDTLAKEKEDREKTVPPEDPFQLLGGDPWAKFHSAVAARIAELEKKAGDSAGDGDDRGGRPGHREHLIKQRGIVRVPVFEG